MLKIRRINTSDAMTISKATIPAMSLKSFEILASLLQLNQSVLDTDGPRDQTIRGRVEDKQHTRPGRDRQVANRRHIGIAANADFFVRQSIATSFSMRTYNLSRNVLLNT